MRISYVSRHVLVWYERNLSRSPEPDSANSRMGAHMGGWALGSGSGRPGDEDGYEHDEDEDDEDEVEEEGNLDWDSAQVRPFALSA